MNWLKNNSVFLVAIFLLAILIWPHFNNSKSKTILPNYVLGKGVWIRNISDCEGGNIRNIVNKAKWAKLDYVLVKTHDGQLRCDELRFPYNSEMQILSLLDKLHKANIKVIAWGYCYGNYPAAEASLAIKSLELGFDGYVFDVEREFNNKGAQAEELCQIASEYRRKHAPEKFLAYSTFSRVNRQRNLPYQIFGHYCDVAMPQAYWRTFKQKPEYTASEMCKIWGNMQNEWKKSGLETSIKPIIPTGHAEAGVPTSEVINFTEAVKGYYGVNFWVWDKIPEKSWQAIRDAPGGVTYQAAKLSQLGHKRSWLMFAYVSLFRFWLWITLIFYMFVHVICWIDGDRRIQTIDGQLTYFLGCAVWPKVLYTEIMRYYHRYRRQRIVY